MHIWLMALTTSGLHRSCNQAQACQVLHVLAMNASSRCGISRHCVYFLALLRSSVASNLQKTANGNHRQGAIICLSCDILSGFLTYSAASFCHGIKAWRCAPVNCHASYALISHIRAAFTCGLRFSSHLGGLEGERCVGMRPCTGHQGIWTILGAGYGQAGADCHW